MAPWEKQSNMDNNTPVGILTSLQQITHQQHQTLISINQNLTNINQSITALSQSMVVLNQTTLAIFNRLQRKLLQINFAFIEWLYTLFPYKSLYVIYCYHKTPSRSSTKWKQSPWWR